MNNGRVNLVQITFVLRISDEDHKHKSPDFISIWINRHHSQNEYHFIVARRDIEQTYDGREDSHVGLYGLSQLFKIRSDYLFTFESRLRSRTWTWTMVTHSLWIILKWKIRDMEIKTGIIKNK